VIAWKFLAGGAVGPFTRFRWPTDGAWVEAPVDDDARWIHACRVADLPYWLGPELWRVELAGDVVAAPHHVVAPRARLVGRVAGWDAACAAELGRVCAARARELARAAPAGTHAETVAGYVATAEGAAEAAPAVAAFSAELLGTLLGGAAAGEAERASQARWLAARLRLDG
jgi:hypothetical protein